ncbi:OsmC family protein [Mammaliicoccus stepanovicii]|uniref:OsmC-like protein n=1 Tax=Mammaliicoccus stepanovicii TaxID=643214 RepID=A0A239Y8J0_9STAP|nr:OsmC family protein [Mammaliicoccus stepanovicii]PNZ77052.1 hypothetical protein CD111_05365 [Mammaliicoccus stepanovicii]GGI43000.1 peroxiredoxin [Mammaliicoccus stepanovicii]SNV55187.1 OsmC-like protein [Mammaliicoccus stepanovicii]
MKSKGIWKKNKAFTIKGESTGYEIVTSPQDDELEDFSARPMEILLNGIIGCMGASICNIMRHHMNKVEDFEIVADGIRAEVDPKYYTHIDFYINIKGDIQAKEIKRATKLSEEKYCSAINSVKATTKYYIKLNDKDLEID